MPPVKSLEWNPRVDPLVKGELSDDTGTFLGFQIPAGLLGGRGQSTCREEGRWPYLILSALISQDYVQRVAGNTKIFLVFVVSASRMKTISI